MKNYLKLIMIALFLGAIDIIPLLMVKAPMFNMISIFLFWLSATLIIYKTKLIPNSILNGLIISIILMLPLAFAVSASNAKDFIPMMSMAILLGPVAGFLIKKYLT